MRLLPRADLIATGDVDHASWNYDGLLGYVSRRRFALVRELLPARVRALLEIGYGSGVFMPELALHCERLSGIDVHERASDVAAVLAGHGVRAHLERGSVEALPYDAGTFDVAVAVSTFEFVADAPRAAREIARVLRPGGIAIVVTPCDHPLLDLALRLATGESAAADFGDRRRAIVPALANALVIERSAWFPTAWPLPVYRALRLRADRAQTVSRENVTPSA